MNVCENETKAICLIHVLMILARRCHKLILGVRTRNGNLSTVRSALLVDWSANALRRNAQAPSQSSWSSSIRFAVKRAVIEFWSVFF
jgi:hypothetical protein